MNTSRAKIVVSQENSLPTRFMGADIHYLQETDSTNNVAIALARQGAPEGTTVVADSQTIGRGQRGNTWLSLPRVGLYISVILRPQPPASNVNHLKLLAAVATAHCISQVSPLSAGIKWPNDVMVNGRKIAGILIETEWNGDAPHYFVVGVGININQTAEIFQESQVPNATSLRIDLGHECLWESVLQGFLIELEKTYLIYQSQGFDPIWQQLKELEIISGSWVEVTSLGHRFEGEVLGISAEGELLVRSGDIVRRISSGRINILSHNYYRTLPARNTGINYHK